MGTDGAAVGAAAGGWSIVAVGLGGGPAGADVGGRAGGAVSTTGGGMVWVATGRTAAGPGVVPAAGAQATRAMSPSNMNSTFAFIGTILVTSFGEVAYK